VILLRGSVVPRDSETLEVNTMHNVVMSIGDVAFIVANNTINKQKTQRVEQSSRGRSGCADYEFAENVSG